ncbi:hypothetical protein AALP_AA1G285000 [Arabis alpina]|uniref:WPP domain-containing protein n=1 Tax=Arabis alpina TaxID=50452 RepID=A0A087HR88_ARAAL|nr:hypothetical protein AALP_AA1G285000 [Arabis alpina]
MAETADTISTTVSPPPESEASSTTLPLIPDLTSEEASKETDLKKESPEKKLGSISLRIWPPTQKTRDAVLKRLIETLSTESILSKRYGTLKSEEANEVAKSIEEKAYDVASSAVSSDEDGIEILQVYSKEISKRMLDSVKARSNNESVVGDDDVATEVSKDDAAPESVKSEA